MSRGRVAVIGAGAAGMLAAGLAAGRGFETVLVERNEKPGRKLMITGKGRCNVTNACGLDEFLSNVPVNPRFLYSALSRFGPRQTMEFFERQGVKLKVERGKRVFPVSDHAYDIVDALRRYSLGAGCRMVTGRARGLRVRDGRACGVELENGKFLQADAVILCTGGLSYPATGSTGDGYAMAKAAGHSITKPQPSLVPIVTVESWPRRLMGLSLRNVTLSVVDSKTGKCVFSELGEMLFTHFGVTGPLILSASSHIRRMEPGRYQLSIDLKPALDEEKLDARLQRDFLKYANREFINSLHDLFPSKLIPVFVSLSGADAQLKVNQITHEMRHKLVALTKNLTCTAKEFRPVEEAIVTSGGVDVKQVDPKTMESKLVRGLYFAGEVLDVDAHTGGFNLQIAFSTGYCAGTSVLEKK